MASGNPTLRPDTFQHLPLPGEGRMTIEGTVSKTALMLALVVLGAGLAFMQGGRPAMYPLMLLGGVGGLVVALTTTFKPTWARVTAPVYALLEGLLIGGVSFLAQQSFPGIIVPAVGLTFATMACMLAAYRSGLIRATEQFKLGVVAATGGIMLFYLVEFGLSFAGIRLPMLHDGGLLSIGVSLFVVGLAALNLVLDFDFIEQGAREGAPAYMEWYGAFGLTVTLVWLYLEVLRLLSKLQSRD